MNWSLFLIAAFTWIFFSGHIVFNAHLFLLSREGVNVPKSMMVASKALALTAMFNLIVFFFVFGAMSGWLQAAAIVVGGYVVSMAHVLIFRTRLLIVTHKVGWLALPVLSVAIWVRAFLA